jgi:hypothetical protein
MIRNSRNNDSDPEKEEDDVKVSKNEVFLETISEIKEVRLKTANK